MFRVTREDIQRIGDEETMMHFLEEKLNLPIPERATLAQIALPLPLPFLGLDESIAEQIIDCQDFSGLPKDALGKLRPFLIRFRHEAGYAELLREVAESLHQKTTNPADLFFICANEYFQPFALAYFDNPAVGNWHTVVLTILAWTQENTHIHISSEHELPIEFLANESDILGEKIVPATPDNEGDSLANERVDDTSETSFDALLETTTTIFANEPSEDFDNGSDILGEEIIQATSEDEDNSQTNERVDNEECSDVNNTSETSFDKDKLLETTAESLANLGNFDELSEILDNILAKHTIKPVSSEALLAKLEKAGTSLGRNMAIQARKFSIQHGCSKAFVLDEFKHQQLVTKDAQSSSLIKSVVYMPYESRWKPEWKHLIWISSSKFKRWPWSSANNEEEAEQIFADTYPAISRHLYNYRHSLKARAASSTGEFYWELSKRVPTREQYPKFYQPKIIYPADGVSLDAGYDTSESFILGNWTCFIPTADLSLLAILNSKLFGWYAKARYRAKYKTKMSKNWLTFKKANMKIFPVANRTETQKTGFSQLVQQILNNPNSPAVPDIEREIDQFVYKLYKLTPAEIALIEEETNQ